MWKSGPLPPNTWNWGAVTLADTEQGFFFADFHGDHVILVPSDKRVEAKDIVLYNNSIELPSNRKGRK